jgi:hypothetical protein
MQVPEDKEDDGKCIRGLKSFFPTVVFEPNMTIQLAPVVVIREQAQARCKRYLDKGYLDFVYYGASMKAKEVAYSRGLTDRQVLNI